ncbi:MAG: RecB-like helicase, partial [Wolinella sp.]
KKLNLSDLDGDFRALKGHLKDYFCVKESQLLRELLSLLEHFRASLWKIIKKEKQLGFDEIAQGAYELLGEGIIEREFLYFRLDSRITHLLIDEFQDTSLLQYRILEPLIAEIKSGISRKLHRSFFYVGDPKQSIYRFRGSHAELFEWVARDMEVRNLPYNYRSAGEIVKFVNKVFAPLYENYYPQEPKNAGGYVKVRADEEPLSGLKVEIQRLLNAGANADDVAILVFNNDDVLSVTEFLKSEFQAIKVVTETSAKLIRQREVRALLRALNYALFGKEVDGVSFLAMVGEQGEEGGNPSFQMKNPVKNPATQAPKSPCKEGFCLEVLDFLRQNSGRKSSELIMEIMERYALASASARRFLEISLEHADLGEFLEYCKKLEEPLSTEELSGVRVLTIHKSKGLEFPYVFVLDRLSRSSNRSDAIFYDYAGIKLNKIFYRLKGRENFDSAYADALKREENLKYQDTLNMLYVAFTRAKSGLFVLLKEQNSAMDMLGIAVQERGNLSMESLRKSEFLRESSVSDLSEQEVLSLWIANLGRQSDFLKKERTIPVGKSADLMAGEAFHMAFEHYIGFGAKEVQIEALLANRYGYFLGAHKIEEIAKHAREIVKSELLGAILNKGKVKCEIPFLEKGKMHRIDLLIECEDEMIIIDYKSTLNAQERDKEQVESYKKFISTRTQKPTKGYLLAYKDEAYLLEV